MPKKGSQIDPDKMERDIGICISATMASWVVCLVDLLNIDQFNVHIYVVRIILRRRQSERDKFQS